MGKVGSKGLLRAVEEVEAWPCFHTHILRADHPSLKPDGSPVVPRTQRAVPPHILAARELRLDYLDRDRPVAVMTPIREPIGRNVSAFVNNLRGWASAHDADPDDVDEMYEVFQRHFPHRQPQEWIESQLNEPFGIDVFAKRFPSAGAVELDASPNRLLILRTTLSDERKAEVLGDFLGVEGLIVTRVNVTVERAGWSRRAAIVQQFKSRVGRDEEYLDSMLELPMASHFFSKKERREIRDEWLQLGRTEDSLAASR